MTRRGPSGPELRNAVRELLAAWQAGGRRRLNRASARELRALLRGSGLLGPERLEDRDIDELMASLDEEAR